MDFLVVVVAVGDAKLTEAKRLTWSQVYRCWCLCCWCEAVTYWQANRFFLLFDAIEVLIIRVWIFLNIEIVAMTIIVAV